MAGHHAHPYYPLDAPIPGWTPNSTPIWTVLLLFGAIVGSVIAGTYLVAVRCRIIRSHDRFAACWFALCSAAICVVLFVCSTFAAFLHLTFESYYIFNRDSIVGLNSLYAQLWKEYTLSDSRYLTSDIFTICVETITVFVWGPLSLLAVISILSQSTTRHFYQVIVCTAHLYGVALYYATNWAELQVSGASYSRPEFLYYWVYYVGFNLPWAIVPPALLYDSFRQIKKAFASLHESEGRRKTA